MLSQHSLKKTGRRQPIRPPVVALVGRANVGKSTLFNRMIEEDRSIVSPIAGTTRDRAYGTCRWAGRLLTLVDTGGLDMRGRDEMERNVVLQAKRAMQEADLIVFVVDTETGPLADDRTLSKELFASKKPIILVANKADNPRDRRLLAKTRWGTLGRGDPMPVSGTNGTGVGDLLDKALQALGEKPAETWADPVKIAIIGRPNVGKSTLTNALIGEERMIVSPIAGTTREPQDTMVVYHDQPFLLIDTAGIRKKARIEPGIEKAGVRKSLAAIERADVVFLVVDLTAGVGGQDHHLAGLVAESGKAVIVVANKWDLVPNKTAQRIFEIEKEIPGHDLRELDYGLIRVISAEHNDKVEQLFDDAVMAREHWRFRLPEKALDGFLRKMIAHEKKFGGVRHPYIYRMAQRGAEPPTYTLAIKAKRKENMVPEAYLRFVERRLREKWDFSGTPVRIVARAVDLTP